MLCENKVYLTLQLSTNAHQKPVAQIQPSWNPGTIQGYVKKVDGDEKLGALSTRVEFHVYSFFRLSTCQKRPHGLLQLWNIREVLILLIPAHLRLFTAAASESEPHPSAPPIIDCGAYAWICSTADWAISRRHCVNRALVFPCLIGSGQVCPWAEL
jgi:hypothetical protein